MKIRTDKITVSLIKDSETKDSQKPFLKSKPKNEYLPRRKSGGLINFYDLGQILIDSAWVDADFSILFTELPDSNGDPRRELDLGDYATRDEYFFQFGVSEIVNKFRRLEKAHGEVFKISISGEGFEEITLNENPNWSEQGLKLTSSQLGADNFTISFPNSNPDTGYFRLFTVNGCILTGSFKNHITNVYDYEADAVSYQPKASDVYFLIPRFLYSRITANVTDLVSDIKHHLNLFWCFHKRTQYLDPLSPYHTVTYLNSNWSNSGSDDDYYNTYSTVPMEKLRANSRRYLIENLGTGDEEGTFDDESNFPPAEFPTPPSVPVEGPGQTLFFNTGYGADNVPEGALVLMIKQGSSFYYVWETA